MVALGMGELPRSTVGKGSAVGGVVGVRGGSKGAGEEPSLSSVAVAVGNSDAVGAIVSMIEVGVLVLAVAVTIGVVGASSVGPSVSVLTEVAVDAGVIV